MIQFIMLWTWLIFGFPWAEPEMHYEEPPKEEFGPAPDGTLLIRK